MGFSRQEYWSGLPFQRQIFLQKGGLAITGQEINDPVKQPSFATCSCSVDALGEEAVKAHEEIWILLCTLKCVVCVCVCVCV